MLATEHNLAKGSFYSTGMYQKHQGICKVFASGKHCKFGRHCRYLHFRKSNTQDQVESTYQHGAVKAEEYTEPTSSVASNLGQSSETCNENGSLSEVSLQGQSYPKQLDRTNQRIPRRRCRYFANGFCAKGEDCTFLHVNFPHVKTSVISSDPGHAQEEEKTKGVISDTDGRKICRFFQRGFCRNGKSCRLLHDRQNNGGQTVTGSENVKDYNQRPKFVATFTPKVEFDIEEVTSDNIHILRDKELSYIRKRFPNGEFVGEESIYKFDFKSTDPDWPYDVGSVEIQLEYPEEYPLKPVVCTLSENERIPETVKRFIWKSAEEWIQRRFDTFEKNGKTELVTREFLRWLDRKLESLFTEGLKVYQKELMAKAAGIEFVTATQLREEFAKHSSDSEQGSNEEAETDYEDTECSDDEDDILNDPLIANPNHQNQLEADKHGTEVKLQQFQLKDQASSLIADRVSIIVQCGRCKNKTEFDTPPGRINVFGCAKCGAEQLVTFRANMAHSFTSVIGYLDLKECIIHDMILSECNFKVGCLECGRDMNFGGIMPGQVKESWCHSCHSKLTVAAESAKFLNLQQVDIVQDDLHRLNIKKVKKVPKDPAIKEGQPLPSEGTCKHYKKSYRWLRFPCCGKAYPCDLCHDDNEGHEFIFANRMICGFCCKEQYYSPDRPCKGCSSSLTKTSSSHWEGGKGCRDKVKMSRNDEAKFKNMNKTVSRKQQSKSSSTKNTKLRHT